MQAKPDVRNLPSDHLDMSKNKAGLTDSKSEDTKARRFRNLPRRRETLEMEGKT